MDPRQTLFEGMVKAYSADLYRFALWLVRNRAQADDLVQETFLRAWRSLDQLHDPTAAKPWLITILRRERARLFERQHAETEVPMGFDMENVAGLNGNNDGPEVFALRRALARLPEEYREPLLLQVVGGYSCEEIGAELGIQPGAVMTRLSRARRQLRQVLGDDDEHERAEVNV